MRSPFSPPDLAIVRAGYLEKIAHNGARWTERFFVLTTTRLHRFVRDRDRELGIFGTPSMKWDLATIVSAAAERDDESGERRRLRVRLAAGNDVRLRAPSAAEALAWADAITRYAAAQRSGKPLQQRVPVAAGYAPPSPASPAAHRRRASSAPPCVASVCEVARGAGVAERVLYAGAGSRGCEFMLHGLRRAATIRVHYTDGVEAMVAVSELLRGKASYPLSVSLDSSGSDSDDTLRCAVASHPTEVHGAAQRVSSSTRMRTRSWVQTVWWGSAGVAAIAPAVAWWRARGSTGSDRAALVGAAALALSLLLRMLCASGVLVWGEERSARAAVRPGATTFEVIAVFERNAVSPRKAAAAAALVAVRSAARAADALMQLTSLPAEIDIAARKEALLGRGGLEAMFAETEDLGTRESLPLDDLELIIARQTVETLFHLYGPWRKLHLRKWAQHYPPAIVCGDDEASTRHPGWKSLDASLLTIFVRGHKGGGHTEVMHWLSKSLAWYVDPILRVPSLMSSQLPFVDETFAMWPSTVYGTDSHGHLLHAERFSEIEVARLHHIYTDSDHERRTGLFYDVLRVRCQVLQTLWYLKRRESKRRGWRIMENILIVDFANVSLATCRAVIRARVVVGIILALGGENFPETMKRCYITNTPPIFTVMWKIAAKMLDPVTLDKIRHCPNPATCRAELLSHGVAKDAIPTWLGGGHEGSSLMDIAHDFVRERE